MRHSSRGSRYLRLEALDESEYIVHEASKRGFLVYLVGPYKSYPPYESVEPEETAVVTTRPTLDEINRQIRGKRADLATDEALELLIQLKRDLRKNTGVNAFLAIDPQIPLHEMDAATQSIHYTEAAVATVFIAPAVGDTLGVGIEIGSVCEHLEESNLREDVAFYGKTNVDSSMIDAVSSRWHVTTDEFRSYDDLYDAIRSHLRAVA